VMKFGIPGIKHYEIFLGWGINGVAGLTRNMPSSNNFTLAGGAKALRLKESLETNQRYVYPELQPHLIFFWDKNESLLFTISQTGIHKLNMIINAYPGFIPDNPLGIYLAANDYLGVHLGIVYGKLPVGVFIGE